MKSSMIFASVVAVTAAKPFQWPWMKYTSVIQASGYETPTPNPTPGEMYTTTVTPGAIYTATVTATTPGYYTATASGGGFYTQTLTPGGIYTTTVTATGFYTATVAASAFPEFGLPISPVEPKPKMCSMICVDEPIKTCGDGWVSPDESKPKLMNLRLISDSTPRRSMAAGAAAQIRGLIATVDIWAAN